MLDGMDSFSTTVLDADGCAPPCILYMPQGRHGIHATVNGAADVRTVEVDESCVASLQADLEEKLAAFRAGAAPRPIVLFNHETGPAAFRPSSFAWEEGKGVVMQGEWTRSGREAVEGGDYAYHSPRFALLDGRPCGLLPGVEVGSLTNDPAFESIESIAAARGAELAHSRDVASPEDGWHDGVHDQVRTQPTNQPYFTMMKEIAKALGLPETASEADIMAAIAKLKGAPEDKNRMQSELDAEREKAKKAEEEVAAARAALDIRSSLYAEGAIADAISAGKLPPKDDEAIQTWKAMFRADHVSAAKALSRLAPNPAFTSVVAGRAAGAGGADRSLADLYKEESH